MKMTQHDRKLSRGCLQVRAAQDTRRGFTDAVVPSGSIGYVLSSRGGDWLVLWPFIRRAYVGDWRTSVHSASELEATGERG